MSDSGTPFVLTLPESLEIVQTYNNFKLIMQRIIDEANMTQLILNKYNYVAVGNERSANFGNNFTYQGVEINHQV